MMERERDKPYRLWYEPLTEQDVANGAHRVCVVLHDGIGTPAPGTDNGTISFERQDETARPDERTIVSLGYAAFANEEQMDALVAAWLAYRQRQHDGA
jgi:hypothetical protein